MPEEQVRREQLFEVDAHAPGEAHVGQHEVPLGRRELEDALLREPQHDPGRQEDHERDDRSEREPRREGHHVRPEHLVPARERVPEAPFLPDDGRQDQKDQHPDALLEGVEGQRQQRAVPAGHRLDGGLRRVVPVRRLLVLEQRLDERQDEPDHRPDKGDPDQRDDARAERGADRPPEAWVAAVAFDLLDQLELDRTAQYQHDREEEDGAKAQRQQEGDRLPLDDEEEPLPDRDRGDDDPDGADGQQEPRVVAHHPERVPDEFGPALHAAEDHRPTSLVRSMQSSCPTARRPDVMAAGSRVPTTINGNGPSRSRRRRSIRGPARRHAGGPRRDPRRPPPT